MFCDLLRESTVNVSVDPDFHWPALFKTWFGDGHYYSIQFYTCFKTLDLHLWSEGHRRKNSTVCVLIISRSSESIRMKLCVLSGHDGLMMVIPSLFCMIIVQGK